MNKPTTDTILVYNRSSRRQFIRTGTAFLLATGALAMNKRARADECDRVPDEENPKTPGNGSDSDAGSGADAAGCGRHREKPKISRLRRYQESDKPVSGKPVEVAKVVA